MMINDNIDVHNGIANGTTAEFVAYLKPGAKLVPIQMFGYWVDSVKLRCDRWAIEGQCSRPYPTS
jgi:hypothetical protein